MDGTILTANGNFLALTGYRLSEIQGKDHSIFVDAAYAESEASQTVWDKLRAGAAGKIIIQINDIFSAIASAVEQQSALTREVSSNMHVASQGVAEISGAMGKIASATENINHAVGKVKTASQAIA